MDKNQLDFTDYLKMYLQYQSVAVTDFFVEL
jgi:hypothetical protein